MIYLLAHCEQHQKVLLKEGLLCEGSSGYMPTCHVDSKFKFPTILLRATTYVLGIHVTKLLQRMCACLFQTRGWELC